MRKFSEYIGLNEGAASDSLKAKFQAELVQLDTQIDTLSRRRRDLQKKLAQVDQRLNNVHNISSDKAKQDYETRLNRKQTNAAKYNYSRPEFAKVAASIDAADTGMHDDTIKVPLPANWDMATRSQFEKEFWQNNGEFKQSYINFDLMYGAVEIAVED